MFIRITGESGVHRRSRCSIRAGNMTEIAFKITITFASLRLFVDVISLITGRSIELVVRAVHRLVLNVVVVVVVVSVLSVAIHICVDIFTFVCFIIIIEWFC